MEQLSQRLIKMARRQADLSQAELARRAGITRSVLNAYEHGRRQPSGAALARILGAAGYDIRIVKRPRLDDERSARILSQVLDLAGSLPYKPKPELRYPPFRQRVG